MSSSRRRSSREPRTLSSAQIWPLGVAVLVAVVVVGGGLVLFQSGRPNRFPAVTTASGQPSAGSPLAGEGLGDLAADTAVADWRGAKTLTEAIQRTLPDMTDTTDRLDEGAATLALWASQYLTWRELMALPETSPALYRKDPAEERGKRLCGAGRITVVRAERNLARRLESDRPLPLPAPAPVASAELSGLDVEPTGVPRAFWEVPGGKVFFAVVDTSEGDAGAAVPRADRDAPPPLVLSVIAARSTGKLVDGDRARVCGVLTGVNVIRGGTSDVLAHRIVGMFDLPENHALPARD